MVLECGDCPSEGYGCHPGASGFTTVQEHDDESRATPTVSVAVDASSAEQQQQQQQAQDGATLPEPVPCQFLDAADVVGKSATELAAILGRPTIIRGLIDHWEAHERFGGENEALEESAGLKKFEAAFGNHSLLAKRANFAREKCQVRAISRCRGTASAGATRRVGGDGVNVCAACAVVHDRGKAPTIG